MNLTRQSPIASGIKPSAILNMLQIWNNLGNFNSYMIVHKGAVVAEGWWKPFAPEKPHTMYSVSKSFTAVAAAFAEHEGLINYEDYVLSYFPEYENSIPDMDQGLRHIQIKHLLSMTTGHVPNADFIFEEENPVQSFFTSKLQVSPGSRFSYNTAATYMVSALIQRASGQTMLEYLQSRFFKPLGIGNRTWDTCPLGITLGGIGLNITTEDLAKLGVFLLNRGSWNGIQLLPQASVDYMTRKHVNTWNESQFPTYEMLGEEKPPLNNQHGHGYGFQFWCGPPEGFYRADGAYGQICAVLPQYDTAVICTACGPNTDILLQAIWDHINDDAFGDFSYDSQELQAEQALLDFSQSISMPLPASANCNAFIQNNGNHYCFEHPYLQKISFQFYPDKIILWLECNGKKVPVCAGLGTYLDNTPLHNVTSGDPKSFLANSFLRNDDGKIEYISAAAGVEDNMLVLHTVFYRTPWWARFAFSFTESTVRLQITFNHTFESVELEGALSIT